MRKLQCCRSVLGDAECGLLSQQPRQAGWPEGLLGTAGQPVTKGFGLSLVAQVACPVLFAGSCETCPGERGVDLVSLSVLHLLGECRKVRSGKSSFASERSGSGARNELRDAQRLCLWPGGGAADLVRFKNPQQQ